MGRQEQFRERGVRAEPDAVAALIQLVGENPTRARGRGRQARDLGARRADRRARGRGARRAERRRADLRADRGVGRARRRRRALGVSETLFEHESRQRRDTAAAARRLARRSPRPAPRAQAARRGGRQLEGGGGAAEARTRSTPGSSYRQAEGFSEEELDDAVVRLAELDGALKGQSRIAPDLEVQRTLVDLTRPPGAPNYGR